MSAGGGPTPLRPALPGWQAWLPFVLIGVAVCGGQTTAGGVDASAAGSASGASSVTSGSSMTSGSGMRLAGPAEAGPAQGAGLPREAGAGAPDAAAACNSCEAFCAGQCIDVRVDPQNCGGCDIRCGGQTPFCLDGKCAAVPCDDGDAAACASGTTCCGRSCCDSTQVCCQAGQSGGGAYPYCQTPSPTVPFACPAVCCQDCGSSDRNLKRDIRPIDVDGVLRSLSQVPVSTWAYKAEPDVRHLGPMAQDFHAAFGLGASDRSYDPIDAHGVAFAAIQALYQRVVEQQKRIDALEQERAKRDRRDTSPPR